MIALFNWKYIPTYTEKDNTGLVLQPFELFGTDVTPEVISLSYFANYPILTVDDYSYQYRIHSYKQETSYLQSL
jgi:hypothetical protein